VKCLGEVFKAAKSAQANQAKLRLVSAGHEVIAANSDGSKVRLSDEAFQCLKEFALDKEEKGFVARYWSVKALGGLDNEGTFETLSAILGEVEAQDVLKIQALLSIGKTGKGDELLARHISSPNFRIREAVCDALRGRDSKYALVSLFQGMVDEDIRVRSAAVEALALLLELPKFKKSPGIVELKKEMPNPEQISPSAERRWFDWMIGLKGYVWAAEDMVGFLKASSPEIRTQVCAALKGAKSPGVLFGLYRGVMDQDKSVREAALGVLKELTQGKDFGLDPAAADKDRVGPEKAWFGFILEQMGDFDWVDIARGSSERVRERICQSVTGMKTKRAVRFLYFMLLCPEVGVKKAATEALNHLKTQVFKEEKPFNFSPEAPNEVRDGLLPPIHEWIKEHQKEFTGP
jgi:hypothetical protein